MCLGQFVGGLLDCYFRFCAYFVITGFDWFWHTGCVGLFASGFACWVLVDLYLVVRCF